MRGLARLFARLALVCALAVFGTTDPYLHGQTTPQPPQDLLLGTWRLDLAKSTYVPGPPPRSETRTYARDGDGVKGTIRRQRADGRKEVIEYRADFDHEYPVTGTEAYDTIRLKRIDARTAEVVLSHAGRVYGRARRVISEDGLTLTIAFRQGDRETFTNNVAIYRKQ
jgi:hypothetical protein